MENLQISDRTNTIEERQQLDLLEGVNQIQDVIKTKRCSRCKQEKELTNFYKNSTTTSGYESQCKDCHNLFSKSLRHKESPADYIGKKYPNEKSHIQILGDSGKRYHSHKVYLCKCDCGNEFKTDSSHLKAGHYKSCGKSKCPYSAKGIKNKNSVLLENKETGFRLIHTKWNALKKGAKERNLEFQITPEDLARIWEQQGGRCYLTGIKLSMGENANDTENITWSVDRIDNDRGYTPDNIIIIHKAVNMSRGTLSIAGFITMCHKVAELFQEHRGVSLTVQDSKFNELMQESTSRIAIGREKHIE